MVFSGSTGKTIPFSASDNGADLVETSFLMAGLLTLRQYFDGNNPSETQIRDDINTLWSNVEWSWFRKNNEDVLILALEPRQSMDHEPADPRLE